MAKSKKEEEKNSNKKKKQEKPKGPEDVIDGILESIQNKNYSKKLIEDITRILENLKGSKSILDLQ